MDERSASRTSRFGSGAVGRQCKKRMVGDLLPTGGGAAVSESNGALSRRTI